MPRAWWKSALCEYTICIQKEMAQWKNVAWTMWKKYNTDASSFLFLKAKLCNTSNSNKRRKLESSSFGLNAPNPPARNEITLYFLYITHTESAASFGFIVSSSLYVTIPCMCAKQPSNLEAQCLVSTYIHRMLGYGLTILSTRERCNIKPCSMEPYNHEPLANFLKRLSRLFPLLSKIPC